MKKWIILALFFVLTAAQADIAPQPDESPTIIPFKIIDNGAQSGIHPETQSLVLIQDENTWRDFWAQHNTIKPAPPAPVVDFDKEMIMTVIDSDQPNSGYYLSLDKIEKHDDELWVYITREQPAPSCMNLGMVSQPFVFATLPITDGVPKLVFATHMYDC